MQSPAENKKISSAEEMDNLARAEYIIDLLHRLVVHHTLWFREVEHQMGFERALKAMDYAWENTRKISLKRFGEEFDFALAEGGRVPAFLADMTKEKQLSLIDAIAKNWLAQDGVWFQAVEFSRGLNDAKRCNDSTWARFSPFEAHSIKKLLNLGDSPGLAGLERALAFRLYGRLNVQTCRYDESGALILEMNECRVQSARQRKKLADYPCKSAGLVEYATFAEAIDRRIKTECIGCPPDTHPSDWFCAWRFILEE